MIQNQTILAKAAKHWLACLVALTLPWNGANAGTTALPSAPGAAQWARRIGGNTFADWTRPLSATTDRVGNVVIVGFVTGLVDFGGVQLTSAGEYDIFVAKYSSVGELMWCKRFGNSGNEMATGVAVDKHGNIYLVGYITSPLRFDDSEAGFAGGADIFVCKMSPEGNCLWARSVGGTGSDVALAVATDKTGNLLVTGYYGFYGSTVDFDAGPLQQFGDMDAFLVKFSPDGSCLWAREFGGPGPDVPRAIAIDRDGNIAVTGSFTGNVDFGGGPLEADRNDLFVAKYSPEGAYVWAKCLGGAEDDHGYSATIDDEGNISVAGLSSRPVVFDGRMELMATPLTVFVSRLDAAGSLLWTRSFFTDADYLPAPPTLTVDRHGNLLLALCGSSLSNSGSGVFASRFEFFLTGLESVTGQPAWNKALVCQDGAFATAIDMDRKGGLHLVGQFSGLLDFGGGSVTNLGAPGGFVVKFDR